MPKANSADVDLAKDILLMGRDGMGARKCRSGLLPRLSTHAPVKKMRACPHGLALISLKQCPVDTIFTFWVSFALSYLNLL